MWSAQFTQQTMPPLAVNSLQTNAEEFQDIQLKFALKNMLPIPSNSEQEYILDEYNLQLAQFSIAVNRVIKEVNKCIFYNYSVIFFSFLFFYCIVLLGHNG